LFPSFATDDQVPASSNPLPPNFQKEDKNQIEAIVSSQKGFFLLTDKRLESQLLWWHGQAQRVRDSGGI
jgi:hypothetical protein